MIKKLLIIRHWLGEKLRCSRIGNSICDIYVSLRIQKKARRLQKKWREIFNDVYLALENTDVKYCVAFGTLLGVVRDGGPIKHDSDIDFAILPGQNVGLVLKSLLAAGFQFKWGFKYRNKATEFTVEKYNIGVDFFIYESSPGGILSWGYTAEGRNSDGTFAFWRPHSVEHTKIEEVISKDLNGIKVNVPYNSEAILRACYGPTWKIPNPHWDWSDDSNPNARKVIYYEDSAESLGFEAFIGLIG